MIANLNYESIRIELSINNKIKITAVIIMPGNLIIIISQLCWTFRKLTHILKNKEISLILKKKDFINVSIMFSIKATRRWVSKKNADSNKLPGRNKNDYFKRKKATLKLTINLYWHSSFLSIERRNAELHYTLGNKRKTSNEIDNKQ